MNLGGLPPAPSRDMLRCIPSFVEVIVLQVTELNAIPLLKVESHSLIVSVNTVLLKVKNPTVQ